MSDLPIVPDQPPAPPVPSVFAMYRAMVGVGLACGLAIVGVFELTKPIIAKNKAEALHAAIFRVVEGATTTETFELNADGKFQRVEAASEQSVFVAYNDTGSLNGIAIEAAGMGYQDVIRVLYGYSPEKDAITGLYVLESKETPGLGDKIEKDPAFLDNFVALDVSLDVTGDQLANAVSFTKSGAKQNAWEVDGITGATISSQAIADILNRSASRWVPILKQQRDELEKPE